MNTQQHCQSLPTQETLLTLIGFLQAQINHLQQQLERKKLVPPLDNDTVIQLWSEGKQSELALLARIKEKNQPIIHNTETVEAWRFRELSRQCGDNITNIMERSGHTVTFQSSLYRPFFWILEVDGEKLDDIRRFGYDRKADADTEVTLKRFVQFAETEFPQLKYVVE